MVIRRSSGRVVAHNNLLVVFLVAVLAELVWRSKGSGGDSALRLREKGLCRRTSHPAANSDRPSRVRAAPCAPVPRVKHEQYLRNWPSIISTSRLVSICTAPRVSISANTSCVTVIATAVPLGLSSRVPPFSTSGLSQSNLLLACRPPNRAASSFASGIIREPIAGKEGICPVDPATVLWVCSPRCAIANIIHGEKRAVDPPAVQHLRLSSGHMWCPVGTAG